MIKIRHLMRAIGRRIFILPAAGIVSNKPEDKNIADRPAASTDPCVGSRLIQINVAQGPS
jgi:hypothetical protein